MSGFGKAPPLTDADLLAREEESRAAWDEQRRLEKRDAQARMVKDAAFIIRKEHGLMHHSTARRLALALFREGLLNFYLYRNVADGH